MFACKVLSCFAMEISLHFYISKWFFFYRDVYEKKFGIGKKKAQKQKKVKKPAPIGDVSSELILEFKNLTLLCFILFLFLCNFDSKDNIDWMIVKESVCMP